MLISFAQIFPIPPFSKEIYTMLKSGYFSELEKGFEVIKDSFIRIKILGKPVYGWIFLEDIEKKYEIFIKVYNNKGLEVWAPGETKENHDDKVKKTLNSLNPQIFSEIRGNKYYSVIPVFIEDRCRFCHDTTDSSKIIGIFTFERSFDSFIYYSSERIIIFTIISIILSILLYLVLQWEPEKKVKELFDKS